MLLWLPVDSMGVLTPDMIRGAPARGFLVPVSGPAADYMEGLLLRSQAETGLDEFGRLRNNAAAWADLATSILGLTAGGDLLCSFDSDDASPDSVRDGDRGDAGDRSGKPSTGSSPEDGRWQGHGSGVDSRDPDFLGHRDDDSSGRRGGQDGRGQDRHGGGDSSDYFPPSSALPSAEELWRLYNHHPPEPPGLHPLQDTLTAAELEEVLLAQFGYIADTWPTFHARLLEFWLADPAPTPVSAGGFCALPSFVAAARASSSSSSLLQVSSPPDPREAFPGAAGKAAEAEKQTSVRSVLRVVANRMLGILEWNGEPGLQFEEFAERPYEILRMTYRGIQEFEQASRVR